MSKKATAKGSITVIPANYQIVEKDGKKVFKLSSKFVTTITSDASTIGERVQQLRATTEGKAQLALDVTQAFDAWKLGDKKMGWVGTGGGLPLFVNEQIDSTCPTQYGRTKDERLKITSHTIFNGVETMVKNGHKALKLLAEREKLIAEGKNPDDAKDKRAYNKDKRDSAEASFQKRVSRGFLILAKADVFTLETIGKAVLWFFPKMGNESDELNEKGKKLQSAVATYLFENRAVRDNPATIPPATNPVESAKPKASADAADLMSTLKKAVKKGAAKSKK